MHDAKHLLEQHSCYLATSENTVTLKDEITEDFNDVEPERSSRSDLLLRVFKAAGGCLIPKLENCAVDFLTQVLRRVKIERMGRV